MRSQVTTSMTVKDPVCGMDVVPDEAAGFSRVGDTVYYFCSEHCKQRFDANPSAFVGTISAPATGPSCPKCGMALEPETIAAAATRTEWTCPMHHEVIRSEPGSCPIGASS